MFRKATMFVAMISTGFVCGCAGEEGTDGPQGPQGEQGIAGTSSWTDGTGVVTTDAEVGIGSTNPRAAGQPQAEEVASLDQSLIPRRGAITRRSKRARPQKRPCITSRRLRSGW